MRKPVTKGNDAIVYDPRKGFRINIKKVENLDGRYLCTANYNNEVRDVEYTVISGTQLDDDFGYQSDAPGNYEGRPATQLIMKIKISNFFSI